MHHRTRLSQAECLSRERGEGQEQGMTYIIERLMDGLEKVFRKEFGMSEALSARERAHQLAYRWPFHVCTFS